MSEKECMINESEMKCYCGTIHYYAELLEKEADSDPWKKSVWYLYSQDLFYKKYPKQFSSFMEMLISNPGLYEHREYYKFMIDDFEKNYYSFDNSYFCENNYGQYDIEIQFSRDKDKAKKHRFDYRKYICLWSSILYHVSEYPDRKNTMIHSEEKLMEVGITQRYGKKFYREFKEYCDNEMKTKYRNDLNLSINKIGKFKKILYNREFMVELRKYTNQAHKLEKRKTPKEIALIGLAWVGTALVIVGGARLMRLTSQNSNNSSNEIDGVSTEVEAVDGTNDLVKSNEEVSEDISKDSKSDDINVMEEETAEVSVEDEKEDEDSSEIKEVVEPNDDVKEAIETSIPAIEAYKHLGESGGIRGVVYEVGESVNSNEERTCFLNMGGSLNEKNHFTGVIFQDDFEKFGGLSAIRNFEGKEIIVQGDIKDYKGTCEIIIYNADQIIDMESLQRLRNKREYRNVNKKKKKKEDISSDGYDNDMTYEEYVQLERGISEETRQREMDNYYRDEMNNEGLW